MRSLAKPHIVLITFIVLFSPACKRGGDVTHAFYYWKSNFNLNANDLSFFKSVEVNKLYLHFFDVTWNKDYKQALPVAKMTFASAPPPTIDYVPVIYIANACIENTEEDSINKLAEHVYKEVLHIASGNGIKFKELQIDCDWTEKSAHKYFALLKQIRTHLKLENKLLSATIRLHQVKYYNITGIPPVDRGMLMFYNMGKVNTTLGYNSIYNATDADKYTASISSYPLPLDLALPVYSWAVCIRNGQVADLLRKTNKSDFSDTSLFSSAGNNIFVSRRSFFQHGIYFMKNDTLKLEDVTPALSESAAANVSRHLDNNYRTVSLFEYDTTYLSSYDKKDIEKIFSAAR